MSMTKVEKARLEDAMLRASLTLPPYEKPSAIPHQVIIDALIAPTTDLPTLNITQFGHPKKVVKGWSANYHRGIGGVVEGITDGYSQNYWGIDRLNTQGGGQYFLTRLEALKVIRWDLTHEVMKKLREIDSEIDKEESLL